MTNRVAFIDLDGVVADSSERFANATVDGKVNWQLALNGEYVHMDTLIDGVPDALNTLQAEQGYRIVFLTSRPDHMREATETWMSQHGLTSIGDDYAWRTLEMKPASAQFTKTVQWKIDRLVELANDLSASEVLLVDDEPAICAELMNRANDVQYKISACSSLALACE